MGKQTSGINGGFQGKVGNAVGYMWRGQWCVRAKPREFHDAKTEKQLEQRALFKASVAFAGRLKDILRMGFQRSALKVHKTECNYFLMVNKHCLAWDGESLAVDYEHLRLSEGPVAPVAFTRVERGANDELVIEFEKNPEHRNCNGNDKVYVAAICAEREEAVLSLPVYRRMKRIMVVLPEHWEEMEVHLYGFVQDNAGRTSESVYINLEGKSLDTADAVEGGADDAAGVAGAFATGVEAGELGMLEGNLVAGDAHRRRRAALDG
jgi:hypothetical protein